MTSFGRKTAPIEIVLNVYDLAVPANDFLFPIGLGFYHTGVEILGVEYTFAAEAGIFRHTPKDVPNAKFRLQLPVGKFEGTSSEIQKIMDVLGNDRFGPNDYNILSNNCNHFSAILIWNLTNKSIPGYINRMANIGDCCSCLIPKQLLQNAPVQPDNNNNYNQEMTKLFGSRANSSGTSKVGSTFSGPGFVLGQTKTTNSSSTDPLTDRREKARIAALARLEQQQQIPQQQSSSDKSH